MQDLPSFAQNSHFNSQGWTIPSFLADRAPRVVFPPCVSAGVNVGLGVGLASHHASGLGSYGAHWQIMRSPSWTVPSGHGCGPGNDAFLHGILTELCSGVSLYFHLVTSGWSAKNVGFDPPAYTSLGPVEPYRTTELFPHSHIVSFASSAPQKVHLSVRGSGVGVGMGAVHWQIFFSPGKGSSPGKSLAAQSTLPQLRRYDHFGASGLARRDAFVP